MFTAETKRQFSCWEYNIKNSMWVTLWRIVGGELNKINNI